MSESREIWYPYKGDYKTKYKGKCPPYYDLNGTGWYDQLKADLPAIREKALAFLKKDGIDIGRTNMHGRVEGTGWDGLLFLFWNKRNEKAISKGKELVDCFNNIEGVVQISLSILQPHTKINAHSGDTDAIYRMHLPIYIPSQLPDCGFTADGITKPWLDDDIIVFCDAYFHEAWNMTDKPRIVLILDVMKEEYLSQKDDICATVLATMKGQAIATKFKPLYKLVMWSPVWVRNMIRGVLKLLPF